MVEESGMDGRIKPTARALGKTEGGGRVLEGEKIPL